MACFPKLRESPSRIILCKKWFTVTGASLLISTTCFVWYWGNMSIYAFSYLLKTGQSSSFLHTPWTLSLYMVVNSFGFVASGYMTKIMGKRLVIAAGIVVTSCGVMTTYFSAGVSIAAFNVTNGVIVGFGNGLINAISLQYAGEWAGKDLGIILGAAQNAASLGGLFINQFITLYVNREDEHPNYKIGKYNLFSQPDVTENVPSMFITLGSIFLLIDIFGLVMVSEFKEDKAKEDKRYDSMGDTEVGRRDEVPSSTELQNVSDQDSKKDFTPFEMIKTKPFFVVIFLCTFSENAMLIFLTYYKVYGGLWIESDYDLTNISTVMSFSAMVGRVVLGRVTDRFGIKTCLIAVFSFLPMSCLFFYFTPMLSKWVYFLGVVLFAFCGGIYSTFGTAIAKMYGTTHFATNFGIVSFSAVAVQLITPMVVNKILFYGWFSLFAFCGVPCVIGLILIVIFIPSVSK